MLRWQQAPGEAVVSGPLYHQNTLGDTVLCPQVDGVEEVHNNADSTGSRRHG